MDDDELATHALLNSRFGSFSFINFKVILLFIELSESVVLSSHHLSISVGNIYGLLTKGEVKMAGYGLRRSRGP